MPILSIHNIALILLLAKYSRKEISVRRFVEMQNWESEEYSSLAVWSFQVKSPILPIKYFNECKHVIRILGMVNQAQILKTTWPQPTFSVKIIGF